MTKNVIIAVLSTALTIQLAYAYQRGVEIINIGGIESKLNYIVYALQEVNKKLDRLPIEAPKEEK